MLDMSCIFLSMGHITRKNEGVVCLSRDVATSLGVKGREGCATGIHSLATRPVKGLLRCALRNLRWVGQSQYYGSAALTPSLLHTLEMHIAQ